MKKSHRNKSKDRHSGNKDNVRKKEMQTNRKKIIPSFTLMDPDQTVIVIRTQVLVENLKENSIHE